MGVELYITRAESWFENDDAQIDADEWLAYVESDPELTLDATNGPYMAVWSGDSAYEHPWLEWYQGNISTKWPDTALYRKMLAVAAELGAQVQDDDGTVYTSPGDWEFDPRQLPASLPPKVSWWRRLFSRGT